MGKGYIEWDVGELYVGRLYLTLYERLKKNLESTIIENENDTGFRSWIIKLKEKKSRLTLVLS